jgi:hypothetical protein
MVEATICGQQLDRLSGLINQSGWGLGAPAISQSSFAYKLGISSSCPFKLNMESLQSFPTWLDQMLEPQSRSQPQKYEAIHADGMILYANLGSLANSVATYRTRNASPRLESGVAIALLSSNHHGAISKTDAVLQGTEQDLFSKP